VSGVGAEIDLGGPLTSRNLQLLAEIAARTPEAVMISVLNPGSPFSSVVSVERRGSIEIVEFAKEFGSDNYVRAVPDGVFGQTLFPMREPLVPDTLYSPHNRFEIYVAADQSDSEIAATLYHELAHVRFGAGHTRAILNAEAEARLSAQVR